MRSRLAIFLAIVIAVGTGTLFVEKPLSAQVNVSTVSAFSLEINGESVALFSEIEGLSSAINSRPKPRSSSTPVTAATVTLRRPVDENRFIWTWQEQARTSPRSAPTSADLVVYGADGSAVMRLRLHGAWPTKVEIGALKAGSSEVLMETVEMRCESIEHVDP